jgi:hypothetical protein
LAMGNLLHVNFGFLGKRQCLTRYQSKKHATTRRHQKTLKFRMLDVKRRDAGLP